MEIDFEAVERNIKKDNLDVSLIRIIYEGLTGLEAKEIIEHQGGRDIGSGKVLGNYPKDRNPLYKEKIKGMLYLGAD